MSQGWICVHRQLLDNPIFKNDKLFRVFMFCLLKASHTDHDQLVGDCIVKLKKGELVTGRDAISKATNLTPQNVRTALEKLKALGILTIKPTNKYSVIAMVSWDKYQQTNQQVTNSQPTSNQQVTTNNNVNNENNGNNVNNKTVADAPKFNFKNELLALGVDAEILADWLTVRKNKKASNTKTAFNGLINEITKSGLMVNDAIEYAASKSWAGFKAQWYLKENTTGNGLSKVTEQNLKNLEGGW
ncbi:MAG: hypothetical protein P8J14_06030 [Emcibacteraceae bacterium]|nr:hypothetical protein [Emcibacteraceae bacterium]